jgi:hypothetical protein
MLCSLAYITLASSLKPSHPPQQHFVGGVVGEVCYCVVLVVLRVVCHASFLLWCVVINRVVIILYHIVVC